MLQTPVRVRMPFDVQIDETESGMKKYSLNISLGGNEDCDSFKNSLEIMDTVIREHVSEKSNQGNGCELRHNYRADGNGDLQAQLHAG